MRIQGPAKRLLVLLLYASLWSGTLVDALIHLRNRSTVHASGPHLEDPAKQSHNDRCLLARPSIQVHLVGWNQLGTRTGVAAGRPAPARVVDFPASRSLLLQRTRAPPVTIA